MSYRLTIRTKILAILCGVSIVSAASKGAGAGGDVDIYTDAMKLRDGGQVTASAVPCST